LNRFGGLREKEMEREKGCFWFLRFGIGCGLAMKGVCEYMVF
jgi:hypothetical protein